MTLKGDAKFGKNLPYSFENGIMNLIIFLRAFQKSEILKFHAFILSKVYIASAKSLQRSHTI